MKIHPLILCVLLASLTAAALAFSDDNCPGQLVTRTGFRYLQDKTQRPPDVSSSPAVQLSPTTQTSLLIKPSFRISDTPLLSGNRRAGFSAVTFNPDDKEYLVVWESDGLTEISGVNDIYGQRLSSVTNERVGIPFRISVLSDGDKNHTSNAPKVVYNRTAGEYLVVWNGSGLFNSPDKFFEVYGQRLSRTGKTIGGNFRISYATDLGKVNTNFVRGSNQVDIAWNNANNEYMVIWKGIGEPEDVVKMEIYGQRLKPNGELLGKSFRISHTTDQGINIHANAPAIAYNSRDNQYFVVWSGGFKNESSLEIWGVGLSAAGEALRPKNEFRISQVLEVGANRATSPQVVYNAVNNEYFVVFQANALLREGGEKLNEVFGQRIDAATLAEIGRSDFRISNAVDAGRRPSKPAITFNSVAKEYLVTWQSIRQNAPYEIFGQRISSSGAEIEGDFQISNIASVGTDRSVNSSSLTHDTANGDYFVVWQGNGVAGTNTAKINEVFGQQLVLPRQQPR